MSKDTDMKDFVDEVIKATLARVISLGDARRYVAPYFAEQFERLMKRKAADEAEEKRERARSQQNLAKQEAMFQANVTQMQSQISQDQQLRQQIGKALHSGICECSQCRGGRS